MLPPYLTFRYLGIGLIIGFLLSLWAWLPWYIGGLVIIITYVLTRRNVIAASIGYLVIGVVVALFRVSFIAPVIDSQLFLGPQEFNAQIVSEPRLGDKVWRYIVEPEQQAFKLLVVGRSYPRFFYGDTVHVRCKRVQITEFSWYQQQGIIRECAFPELSLVSSWRGSMRAWLLQLRSLAGDKLRTVLSEPYATLATGMLWGDDAGLPRELINDFRRTSTSHLLAVSGANVTVLVDILFVIFLNIGWRRRWASLAAIVMIGLFVLFTGAEPAVVRAGVMGCLVMAAKLVSRQPDNFNIMIGVATTMLLIDPTLLINLGFQLSFAALVGMSWLGVILKNKLTWLTEHWGIRAAAADTLSATICTLPIILIRLGQLSIVSPLVNIMVAPAVQFVFILGLPILILSFLPLGIAELVGWTITVVLWYIITIVKAWARLPWAAASNVYFGYIVAFVMYAGLVRWLKGLWRGSM